MDTSVCHSSSLKAKTVYIAGMKQRLATSQNLKVRESYFSNLDVSGRRGPQQQVHHLQSIVLCMSAWMLHCPVDSMTTVVI